MFCVCWESDCSQLKLKRACNSENPLPLPLTDAHLIGSQILWNYEKKMHNTSCITSIASQNVGHQIISFNVIWHVARIKSNSSSLRTIILCIPNRSRSKSYIFQCLNIFQYFHPLPRSTTWQILSTFLLIRLKPKQTFCIPKHLLKYGWMFLQHLALMPSAQRWADNQCCRCIPVEPYNVNRRRRRIM